MGLVDQIEEFRLNIDSEYQGWILGFATLTAVWVYCLPCYCAGWSCPWARRYASWIQMRLPYFLLIATFFNIGMMYLVITWLPDWAVSDYMKCLGRGFVFTLKNAMKFMTSIAMIAVFLFVFAFKDKFAKLAGVDYNTVFRFKLRDMCPGARRERAIEIVIYKVEELKAASVFAPNNVFLEARMGYNEPMKTRVHNNAGSSCIMRERIQLNFDENEDEELLKIFVKNQKVMGSSELCHLEIKTDEIIQIEKDSRKLRSPSNEWEDKTFVEKSMIPVGKIWFRVESVDNAEDYNAMNC